MLRAYGVTDKGRVRPTNEDHFGIDPQVSLCVVADGMGGHNAGEVASRLAVEGILDYVGSSAFPTVWPFGFDESLSNAGNLLRTAVHIANVHVLEEASSAREYGGMGTTIVASLVRGGRLSVAHVGDSRLYVFGSDGLHQVTSDDSWVAALLAQNPDADAALLKHHPMRHALTNVVGTRRSTTVHVSERTLSGGELVLLTTDGVHGVLDDRRIEKVLVEGGNTHDMAQGLVSAALARGSRDNCTAVVAQYVPD
jgi:protein phosphatase